MTPAMFLMTLCSISVCYVDNQSGMIQYSCKSYPHEFHVDEVPHNDFYGYKIKFVPPEIEV